MDEITCMALSFKHQYRIGLIERRPCKFVSFSTAQPIRNPTRTPNWIAETLDGRQRALAGVLKVALGYDGCGQAFYNIFIKANSRS